MNFKYGTYGAIAKRDLEDMEFLKDSRPHIATQSAQQAIEKILKHYINETYTGLDKSDILKVHKLILLANKTNIPELMNYRSTLRNLTDFYFEGRYPGIDYFEPTVDDLNLVVQDVRDIFQIVENYISNINVQKTSLLGSLNKMNLKSK